MKKQRLQIREVVVLSLLVLWLVSTVDAGEVFPTDTVKVPALRDEILTRFERDQDARKAVINWSADHGDNGVVDEDSLSDEEKDIYTALGDEVVRIDAENTKWLIEIVDEHGWPAYSDVGVDAGDAAWLLVQHADANPAFQRQCLDLMTALPKDEMSQSSLAYLTDRVLLAEGKNQLYGTQFVVRDGEWVPLRLEDEENVDARRTRVGLPPMAEYRAMLEAVMRGEVKIE
jgi:hypothetical protein